MHVLRIGKSRCHHRRRTTRFCGPSLWRWPLSWALQLHCYPFTCSFNRGVCSKDAKMYFASTGTPALFSAGFVVYVWTSDVQNTSFNSSCRVSQTLLIPSIKTSFFFAGDGRIELPTVLLESAVIPLN